MRRAFRYDVVMQLSPDLRPGRLDLLVQERLRELSPEMARLSQSVTQQISTDVPERPVDHALIKEAVGCLVSAAMQHAGEGGRLRVTVKASRDAVMFSAKAAGAGLTQVQREMLFTGEGRPGTLSRARAIVSAHGGVTWANGAPGRGLTFYMTLPFR